MPNEHETTWESFAGAVRLFPLPNLVIFPSIVQPLHIFEPRYRQMTEDALKGDRLIAMALLQKDWESDYLSEPEIYPVVCISKIMAEQKLEDGRFNILVRGVKRARVRQELTSEKLYRSAEVELLEEDHFDESNLTSEYRRQLLAYAPLWYPDQPEVQEQFNKLNHSELPLNALCDVISFALPLSVEQKQELLTETDVERRVIQLLHHLQTKNPHGAKRPFPPTFSEN